MEALHPSIRLLREIAGSKDLSEVGSRGNCFHLPISSSNAVTCSGHRRDTRCRSNAPIRPTASGLPSSRRMRSNRTPSHRNSPSHHSRSPACGAIAETASTRLRTAIHSTARKACRSPRTWPSWSDSSSISASSLPLSLDIGHGREPTQRCVRSEDGFSRFEVRNWQALTIAGDLRSLRWLKAATGPNALGQGS